MLYFILHFFLTSYTILKGVILGTKHILRRTKQKFAILHRTKGVIFGTKGDVILGTKHILRRTKQKITILHRTKGVILRTKENIISTATSYEIRVGGFSKKSSDPLEK